MTVSLFPRLDALCVAQCLEDLDALIAEADRPLSDDRFPPGTGRTAIGGAQISLGLLADLRNLLLADARSCGFPDRGSVSDRARFDVLATATLADFAPLDSGESDRDDVWAFITTVLMPDVAAWRYADRSPGRFEGGVRNTFQRLWMRAWALDLGQDAGKDRWSLVDALSEDALVQLTERPAIGADRDLSLAIARAWVRTAGIIGASNMQAVMRKAIIDIRIRNEIQLLGGISASALQRNVDRIFARSAGLEVSEEERPSLSGGLDAVYEPQLSQVVADEKTEPEDAGGKTSSPVPEGSGTGEAAIQHAILELMLDGRAWSNSALKSKLGMTLPLTEADREVGARPSEQVWENRVNNALARARTNSLYSKGFVENRGHGLHKITEEGARHIRSVAGSAPQMTEETKTSPGTEAREG